MEAFNPYARQSPARDGRLRGDTLEYFLARAQSETSRRVRLRRAVCLAESETPKRRLSRLQRIPAHRVISMLRDGHAAVLSIGVIENGLGKGKLEHDLALVISHLKNGAHEVLHAFDP